jgi:hypothetical protein
MALRRSPGSRVFTTFATIAAANQPRHDRRVGD